MLGKINYNQKTKYFFYSLYFKFWQLIIETFIHAIEQNHNRKKQMSTSEIEEESLLPANDRYGQDSNEITIRQSLNSIKEKFLNYSKKVNWFVFFLITFYTACSTYSSIGGIWTELPFMVDQLKEGWRLPTILTGTGQVAQLGTMVRFRSDFF